MNKDILIKNQIEFLEMNKIKLKPQGKLKLKGLQKREPGKQIIEIHGGQNEQFISHKFQGKRREENKYLKI